MKRRWGVSPALLLICALFFLAGVLRLNDLSVYNPDSTRYLIWGNAIAHGHGFVDATQPEADRYVIHAPLYAVLLAPVEIVFPNSLTAAKIASILWGIAAIALFYLFLNRLIGTIPAMAGTIMMACNPLTLLYSTEVLSEAPFLVFALIVLNLVELPYGDDEKQTGPFAILLGACALIPLLREVGVAIVVATAVSFAVQGKARKAALIVLCAGLVTGLWYLRNNVLVTPTDGSQAGNLSLLLRHFVTPAGSPLVLELLQRAWIQGKEYALQLSGMLLYPQFGTAQMSLIVQPSWLFTLFQDIFDLVKYPFALVSAGVAVVGVYADFKRSNGAIHRIAFGVLYLCGIFLYPIHDVRFLFPMLPLIIFYGLSGIKRIVHSYAITPLNAGNPWIVRALALFAAALVPNLVGIGEIVATNLAYQKSPVMFHQRLASVRDYPPIFAQPWSILAAWIRQHTADSIVIASSAKDIAPMVGARKILELDPGVPLPEFERMLRDNAVAYVISPVKWDDVSAFEFHTRESRRLAFEPVYSVANLRLFKVRSKFSDRDADAMTAPARADTLTAGGLVKRGRALLLTGDYRNGELYLARAKSLAPLHAEVVYQYAIARAFAGDTAAAISEFQSLLTLPQAGSYLYATERHLDALRLLSMSRKSKDDGELRSHEAASIYWNLGYPLRAEEVMDESFRERGSYFVGLLWGFHYALQNGNGDVAKAYYDRLLSVDSSNAVVKIFHRVLAIRDSLSVGPAAEVKSELHLRLAALYRQIELFEEAIDEAERSLGEDPRNAEAYRFLVQSYEAKRSARGMLRWLRVESLADPSSQPVLARIDSLVRAIGK